MFEETPLKAAQNLYQYFQSRGLLVLTAEDIKW